MIVFSIISSLFGGALIFLGVAGYGYLMFSDVRRLASKARDAISGVKVPAGVQLERAEENFRSVWGGVLCGALILSGLVLLSIFGWSEAN